MKKFELCLSHGVCPGPFSRCCDGGWFIIFPSFCYIGSQWVVWVWRAEESLNGEKDSSNLESWRPVALENIQADTAELVNVGMVDLSQESNLRWGHWVIIWEEKFQLEDTPLVWRLRRAVY